MKPPLSAVFLLLLSASLCVGASCGGGTGTAPETESAPAAKSNASQIEELPQVDTHDLTDAEKKLWVSVVNDQLSPCGDPISVAKCVATKNKCSACVGAARYLVRLVMEGYDRDTLAEQFRGRFSKAGKLDVSTDADASRGAPMAKVTIVEFSDFECPHCGLAHPELVRILRELDGSVRLVYKYFPISGHPHAMPAARAAEAARLQGKFWEMHDRLFEHQRELEDDKIKQYATEIGLDMPRFEADMASEAVQKRIDSDKAEGEKLGVAATPSFFINGRLFRESSRTLGAYLREELDL